ncbi:hypothetical protein, partial [Myroides odoratimimus]|uniref:hypothetical protein n=1 Tax=Myroides odoratimimus TaxID=76832 RepID=UPI002DBE361B
SSLYYFKQTYYLTLAYEIWAWSGGYISQDVLARVHTSKLTSLHYIMKYALARADTTLQKKAIV